MSSDNFNTMENILTKNAYFDGGEIVTVYTIQTVSVLKEP